MAQVADEKSQQELFDNRVAEGDLLETYICKNPIVYIFSHDEFKGYWKPPMGFDPDFKMAQVADEKSQQELFDNRVAEGDLLETYICKNPIVYIFSHDELFQGYWKPPMGFDPGLLGLPDRLLDERRIIEHFRDTLHYHVVDPFVNLTTEEVGRVLKKESSKDFSDYDGVIVWVISLFKEAGKYLSMDGFYTEDDVTKYFKGSINPQLILKPKIFIFQAVEFRGYLQPEARFSFIFTKTHYSLPTDANLFILRSSLDYLTDERASWFVNEMCDKLVCQEPFHNEIENILRSCQEKIVKEKEERRPMFKNDKNVITIRNKQTNKSILSGRLFIDPETNKIPFVSSTLLYKLYFNTNNIRKIIKKKAERYDSAERNGHLLIFNYNRVCDSSGEWLTREGTKYDVEKMKTTFEKLDFEVSVENDLKLVELRDKLSEARDYSKYMCVIVAVLTHGEDMFLHTFDENISPDKIMRTMASHKTLEGKPKIFIFQHCRGKKMAQGVALKGTVTTAPQRVAKECNQHLITNAHSSLQFDILEVDVLTTNKSVVQSGVNQKYSSPASSSLALQPIASLDPSSGHHPRSPQIIETFNPEKDTLILYSTSMGNYAVRDTHQGTWLIQDLCSELDTQTSATPEISFTDVLIGVQRRVSLREYLVGKQMPVYGSTLTKRLIIRSPRHHKPESK